MESSDPDQAGESTRVERREFQRKKREEKKGLKVRKRGGGAFGEEDDARMVNVVGVGGWNALFNTPGGARAHKSFKPGPVQRPPQNFLIF